MDKPDKLSYKTTAVFLAAVLAFIWLPRLNFADSHVAYCMDEAVFALVGQTVHAGGIPYKDAMDNKPPVLYDFLSLVDRLFGKGNIKALHLSLAFVITVTALILFAILAVVRNRRAGILAALVFSIASFNQHPMASLSFETEWLMIVFTSLGILLLLLARRKSSGWMMFLSGISFGLAIMTKQSALFDLLAAAAFLFVSGFLESGPRLLFRPLFWLLAGAAAVVGGISAYFYFVGAWKEYLYAAWQFSPGLISAVPLPAVVSSTTEVTWSTSVLARNALILFFPASAALIYYVFVKKFSKQAAEIYFFCFWAVAAMLAIFFSRFHIVYYFIPTLLPFGLLSGLFFEEMLEKLEAGKHEIFRKMPSFVLLFLSIAFIYPVSMLFSAGKQRTFRWQAFPWVTYPPDHRYVPFINDPSFKSLVAYIDGHTRPSDKIFVWGWEQCGKVYLISHRDPATRYIVGVFLIGQVVGFPPRYDTKDIPADAWKSWKEEMDRSRPPLIIDLSVHDNWGPPEHFPVFKRYLDEHYRLVKWPRHRHWRYRVYRRIN